MYLGLGITWNLIPVTNTQPLNDNMATLSTKQTTSVVKKRSLIA